MSKRANGEGSISKRANGTWRASLSYRDEAGQPRRREVYGKTQAEVRAKLKDARERLDAGAPVVDARMTVESWLTEWTGKALEASDRRRATKDLYAMMCGRTSSPPSGPSPWSG